MTALFQNAAMNILFCRCSLNNYILCHIMGQNVYVVPLPIYLHMWAKILVHLLSWINSPSLSYLVWPGDRGLKWLLLIVCFHQPIRLRPCSTNLPNVTNIVLFLLKLSVCLKTHCSVYFPSCVFCIYTSKFQPLKHMYMNCYTFLFTTIIFNTLN